MNDPATWPDWYLAGVLRSIIQLSWQRPADIPDDELIRVWRAYAAAAPYSPAGASS